MKLKRFSKDANITDIINRSVNSALEDLAAGIKKIKVIDDDEIYDVIKSITSYLKDLSRAHGVSHMSCDKLIKSVESHLVNKVNDDDIKYHVTNTWEMTKSAYL